MKCLILASGFGTRLYPVTKKTAKGLLPYKGKPVIDYIVESIPGGIEINVASNRKFEAQYRKWQGEINRDVRLFVEPVENEEQSLGAVGSLEYWVRQNAIDDDLLVIAGDNYFEMDMTHFISRFDGEHTLVAVYDIGDRRDACQFGVVQLDEDKITSLAEKPREPQSSLVATACYLFPAGVLAALNDYCKQGRKDNLGNFIAHLIGCGSVQAYVFNGAWFDIGNIWPRLEAENHNKGGEQC